MKVFRFRGARILEWRRVQADAARVAFVRASESVREAAARVDDADAQGDRAARDYVAAMASPSEVGTHLRYRNWIDRQRGHAATCRRTHQERRVVADRTAAALMDANRHVKIMERLRDRARDRHVDLERQADIKALDELATLQYARRSTEEGADREH